MNKIYTLAKMFDVCIRLADTLNQRLHDILAYPAQLYEVEKAFTSNQEI